MHTGSYGLMSADNSVQPAGPGGQESRTPTWPIWSGPVPPLADGFTIRPDTVPGLETTLVPGATVALVPDQAPSAAWDWRRTSGKTQLARHFAESLWDSPGVDVLTWVAASSRASVLSGFVQAAAAMGAGDAGDAESVGPGSSTGSARPAGCGSSCSTTCATRRTCAGSGRRDRRAGC